jgi:hypothetical protein
MASSPDVVCAPTLGTLAHDLSASELQNKAEWLKGRVDSSVESVRKMRDGHQRKASLVKILSVTLSAAVTVLIGWQTSGWDTLLRNVALALGATVTLLSALEPFFNFRAIWIESEQAKSELHRLQDNIQFYIVGTEPEKLDIEVLNRFCQIHDDIWSRFAGSWQEHRQSGRFNP